MRTKRDTLWPKIVALVTAEPGITVIETIDRVAPMLPPARTSARSRVSQALRRDAAARQFIKSDGPRLYPLIPAPNSPAQSTALWRMIADLVRERPGIRRGDVMDCIAPDLPPASVRPRERVSIAISHMIGLGVLLRRGDGLLHRDITPARPKVVRPETERPSLDGLTDVERCRAEKAKRAPRDAERIARCRELLDDMEARQRAGQKRRNYGPPINARELNP